MHVRITDTVVPVGAPTCKTPANGTARAPTPSGRKGERQRGSLEIAFLL